MIGGMKPLNWPEYKAVYSDGHTWTFVARHIREARDRAENRYPGLPERELLYVRYVKESK